MMLFLGQAHEPAAVLEGVNTRPVPRQEQVVVESGEMLYCPVHALQKAELPVPTIILLELPQLHIPATLSQINLLEMHLQVLDDVFD